MHRSPGVPKPAAVNKPAPAAQSSIRKSPAAARQQSDDYDDEDGDDGDIDASEAPGAAKRKASGGDARNKKAQQDEPQYRPKRSNKDAAGRYRQKKKIEFEEMSKEVQILREENSELLSKVNSLTAELSKANALLAAYTSTTQAMKQSHSNNTKPMSAPNQLASNHVFNPLTPGSGLAHVTNPSSSLQLFNPPTPGAAIQNNPQMLAPLTLPQMNPSMAFNNMFNPPTPGTGIPNGTPQLALTPMNFMPLTPLNVFNPPTPGELANLAQLQSYRNVVPQSAPMTFMPFSPLYVPPSPQPMLATKTESHVNMMESAAVLASLSAQSLYGGGPKP